MEKQVQVLTSGNSIGQLGVTKFFRELSKLVKEGWEIPPESEITRTNMPMARSPKGIRVTLWKIEEEEKKTIVGRRKKAPAKTNTGEEV